MSEEVKSTESEVENTSGGPAPAEPSSPEDKLNSVVERLAQQNKALYEEEEAPEEPEEPVSEAEEELKKPAAKEMTKSEYYEKLSHKDVEVRQLKQQLKQLQEQDVRQLAKTNPFEAMRQLGLDSDDVLALLLDPEAEIGNKEPEYSEEYKALQQQLEELKQQNYHSKINAQISGELSKINTVLAEQPDKWEIIAKDGQQQLVLDTAVQYFAQNGETATYSEIMDLVEEALYNQMLEDLESKKRYNKLSSHLSVATPPAQQSSRPKAAATAPAPTLSSYNTNSQPSKRDKTDEERIARAIAIAKGLGD